MRGRKRESRAEQRDARIDSLAETLGMSREECEQYLLDSVARRILPRKMTGHHLLPDIEVETSGVEPDGTAVLTLTNGLRFYGPASSRQRAALYRIMRSKLQTRLDPDAYGLAVDVNQRYGRAFSYERFPGAGGVVIEAGARRGYQALGFGQRVGSTGRVLAIEMVKDDYDLMARTFAANAWVGELTAIEAAVWSEDGVELPYARSIHAVDHAGTFGENAGTSRSMTLATVMEDHSIDRVDFLNVMVNGAELELLKGLGDRIDDVRVIRIAAYYGDEHGDFSAQCARYVESRGGRVLSREFPGSTWLVPRPFIGEFG